MQGMNIVAALRKLEKITENHPTNPT